MTRRRVWFWLGAAWMVFSFPAAVLVGKILRGLDR